MSVNCDRVCRLCLSSRGELLPIFPTTSSDDSEPHVLASKIKDCVSVEVNENDELPTNICRKCVDNVNNWHKFKNVCERTQNKLQSLVNKDGNQLEEIQVKNEPLSDEAYDDGVVIEGAYPDNENVIVANKVQPEGPPILASLGLTPRSDKKCVDPRMDWHRVCAILDMVQDNEVIDSLQSKEECDVLQHSDHDSDTEAELQPDIEDEYVDCKKGYACKNKKIISKNPKLLPSMNNIKIREAQQLRKRKLDYPKQHCPRPKNAWQLLFTDDLLELIVNSTNEYIVRNEKSESIATNVSEIKTLIGILYLHGIMRSTHEKCTDLWRGDLGVPCVRNSMKYERFKYLLQNLSFDQEGGDSIIQFDIMKRMRKVFEIFAMNCRTAHGIGNIAVIDEVIVPVYGPCPFRYDIDKKPLKRGIKMILLVDTSTFYISNLDIITDPYFGAEEITNKLVQHLAGSGISIVMDSWFTSLTLMERLRNEYQLFTIAALNPSNDWIPPLFLSQYRKCRTFMSGFIDHDISLTSYVNSDLKAINIITNEPRFYRKGHVNQTTVVSVYKKNQSAVEVVDVVMNYYTTMQHTNDWTLSLFFTLLNIASVNAQVLWSSQNTNVAQRRTFIKDLALSLMVPEERSPISTNKLRDVCERGENSSLLQEIVHPYYKNRRRCRICVKTTKRDRRTKQFCVKCGQPICKEHSVNICTMCGS